MNTQHIWTDYNEVLMKYIKNRVKNEYDAEDILQDVFRKIHHSIHQLADERRVQSWVLLQ
ncbi:sigma factor [Paenibacillus alkalitolerans]|uniref:sigma factor n=1 Tax=Paenibacillus alkalitolerans TaxID=2799335 RepID=UPI0018F72091|nr:sigma factor [Paenibacillus alkalitolerans]